MKILNTGLALLIVTALTACSSMNKPKTKEVSVTKQETEAPLSHESISRLIQNWPTVSKSAANSMISKYGLPQEATSSMLVWDKNAPFKRTMVISEEITHNFPFPHYDVMEQTVNYKVPANKADKLLQFDGSLIIDRTKGQLSARGDKEEMNILALNLADEIIRGSMSVEAARVEFARSAQAVNAGNSNQFSTALNFAQSSETADADMAIKKFKGMKEGLNEKDAEQAEEAQESLESDNLEE